ncbi:MAG: hypothetical protein GYB68_10305 [Chloroflexi bacterium]|nr:hypothetical protein [Chloroflexota bacterium]
MASDSAGAPYAAPITLSLVAALAVIAVVLMGVWHTPLILDSSVHLYLGQAMLRGATPYESIIYIHMPLRFALSWSWAWSAQFLGLDVIAVTRLLHVGVGLLLLVLVYQVSADFTAKAFGGVLAGLLLLGIETAWLHPIAYGGPHFKLWAALLVMLTIWLSQRERWLWTGVALACAASIWLPSLVIGLGVVAALWASSEQPWWQGLLQVIGGASIVFGLSLAWVLALGAWRPFVDQVLLASLSFLSPAGGSSAASTETFWMLIDLAKLAERVAIYFRGDLLLAIICGAGLLWSLLRVRQSWSAARSVLLIGVLPLLVLILAESGSGDFLVLFPLLAVFGADLLVTGAEWLAAQLAEARLPLPVNTVIGGMLMVSLLIYGWLDLRFDERRASDVVGLHELSVMAVDLDGALQASDQVQSFQFLWFNVLTERDNATPMIQLGSRARRSLALADSDLSTWQGDVLVSTSPALVFIQDGWATSDPFDDWLADDYLLAGEFVAFTAFGVDRDTELDRFAIYVRADRSDLLAATSEWPWLLRENRP